MKKHVNNGWLLTGVALVLAGAGALAMSRTVSAQDKPLDVVPDVDLQRYSGKWFEVARLPNEFQDDCARDVTATYTPREDGRITVVNRCVKKDGSVNEAEGVARRVDGKPPSILQVRFAPGWLSFLPNVWGDYQIIELAPDYTHAVVASPDRKYLWILARKPSIDASLYEKLTARAKAQGFDVTQMLKTEQSGK